MYSRKTGNENDLDPIVALEKVKKEFESKRSASRLQRFQYQPNKMKNYSRIPIYVLPNKTQNSVESNQNQISKTTETPKGRNNKREVNMEKSNVHRSKLELLY